MTNTSMATASPYSRLNEIKESVEKSIVKVKAQLNSEDAFSFEMKKLPLAKLSFYDISVAPITLNRRDEDIEADGVNDFFLSLLIQGEAIVRQDNCCVTMRPGDLLITANGQPHVIEYTKSSRRLLLHVPKQIFYERLVDSGGGISKVLEMGKTGLSSIVTSMFIALTLQGEALDETEQHILAESFLDLIGALIRSNEKEEKTLSKGNHAALLRRVLRYMDQHYSDCNLSPEKVAEANGISTRYLHCIFQKSGLGVSRWIWERRLNATRKDLLDPAKFNMRVSEIAFSHGFNTAAHFSRSFRARFGVSPKQLRAAACEDISGVRDQFFGTVDYALSN